MSNEIVLTASALVEKGKGKIYSMAVFLFTNGTNITLYDSEVPFGVIILKNLKDLKSGYEIDLCEVCFENGLYVKIDGTAEIKIWYK